MSAWLPYGLAGLAVLACGGVILLDRLRLRRTMDALSAMLEEALAGHFDASHYDESRLSALEHQMARYLAASDLSNRNLRRARERVEQMVADISHQTKTPIANLLLYAGLLQEQELPPLCRDYVETLAGQAEKLRFLIDALVKAGRLESGIIQLKPRQQDLQPLLRQVAEQAIPRAEQKGLAFVVESTGERACYDAKWTGEALYNLVDNAIKYTPAGGKVTLRAAAFELFCRIDVEDTGIGLAEEEQSQVFQRFYRSPAVADAPGVGLGLPLAREIIAGQGGYIKVRSTVGEGSTFSIFLPTEGRNLSKLKDL